MNKIITIGREFGSGGRELGRKLAEQLGYAYYDKEIVAEIAKRTDLSEKYVQSIVEHKPMFTYPVQIGRSFTALSADHVLHSSNIYAEQCNILEELAQKSDCIIVGRCADKILKKYNPYKIFVYADTESKLLRCKSREEEGRTDKKIVKLMKKVDKNRAQYYNFYTNGKWGDKLEYDICINTTNKSIDDIVPYIASLIKNLKQ